MTPADRSPSPMIKVAVTGATGRVGGRIASACAAKGFDVAALSRTTPAGNRERVSWRHADYDDPRSLRAAFDQADVAVVVSSDGEAHRVLAHHYNIVEAVSEAGVPRVIYLSGLDTDLASPFCYAATNGLTEVRLRALDAEVAFVRASVFTEFFALWILSASEELHLPMGNGRVSLVARADVADCMAALVDSHATGELPVTGPEPFGLDELAALSSEVLRRSVAPVDVSLDDFRASLVSSFDPWWAYAYTSMFESIRQDRWAHVSSGVRDVTGSAPRPAGAILHDLLT